MLDHQKISRAYPQPDQTSYFNTSSFGLVSRSGIEKAHKFNENLHAHGSKAAEQFMAETMPQIRKTVSTFIDAPVHEIAFIPNFSYGLSTVIPAISGLKRVLLFKDDYPSLIQPFLINDFEVHWIDSRDGFAIDMEELKALIITHEIEILAISHVQWMTGFMIDIDQLGLFCKTHNVLYILDGTQSLGSVPFSFNRSDVNIYISSNYKWMNAGLGTGIMCINQETMTTYPPKTGGYNSYKYVAEQWEYRPSINSYEPGLLNMPGLTLLQDALLFKMEIGVHHIAEHKQQLLDKFTKKLVSTSFNLVGTDDNTNRSNIVSFRADPTVARHLNAKNIVVKMRQDTIRVGIHFYNTEEDIDRLIHTLETT